MVQKIHILPQDVVLKIAAGEVVERPASVVKELIENSLDAGARRIDVRVTGAGVESIEVIDDGCGIHPDDMELVFHSHATSKIRSVEDIFRIQSFGFRGEALSSIARVSRVEMVSKVEDGETGFLLYLEGGEIKKREEVPFHRGTRISVRDLFYNVPARKKFLRAPQTEMGLLSAVVERFSIANPDIYFNFSLNGKKIFDLQSVRNQLERIAMIFGEGVASRLVHYRHEQEGITIAGFASPPEVKDLRGSYIYVNKRFIRDRMIQRAIQKGYAPDEDRKDPYFVILFIDLPPDRVDVNVHPQKYEVRFKEPGKIFSAVSYAISSAFRKVIPQTLSYDEKEDKKIPHYERIQESLESYLIKEGFLKFTSEPRDSSLRSSQREGLKIEYSKELSVLLGDIVPKAQVFDKYIICETPEELVLIDQHAAHEILTFYKLKSAYSEKINESQYLLTPEVLDLPPSELNLLMTNKDLLESIGFELELFGEGSIIIRAVPSVLEHVNLRALFSEILECLHDSAPAQVSGLDALISTIACHGSVRAGKRLKHEEMLSLIDELREALISPYCPHGRPVLRILSLEEIERWFRRK